MTDPTLIAVRPRFVHDYDRDYGRDEVVGPGGLDRIGDYTHAVVLRNKIALKWDSVCESPIELELGAALYPHLYKTEFTIVPQHPWRRFRMDFAIMRGGIPVLFIECDGREFHSSPSQIERDRYKDQIAKEAGIPLLRFTGSAIYRELDSCVCLILAKLVSL